MKCRRKDSQSAVVYEPRGRGFESCQARHSNKGLGKPRPLSFLQLCRKCDVNHIWRHRVRLGYSIRTSGLLAERFSRRLRHFLCQIRQARRMFSQMADVEMCVAQRHRARAPAAKLLHHVERYTVLA